MPRSALAFALTLVCAGCAAGPPGAARCDDASLAFRNVSVVDVEAGRVEPGRTVLIAGTRICAVGPSDEMDVPASAEVVDGTGRYLMPGLWDMHVHALWDPSVRDLFMPEFLRWGVTGVRDMGGDLRLALESRGAQREGTPAAPTLVIAGPIVDGPAPVHGAISIAVGDSAEAIAAVDSLAGAGVDFIKVYTLLPREAYFVTAREARRRGLPFAGHVPGEVTVAEAAAAGQRSIEHLREELGIFCSRSDSIACRETLAALAERETAQTPTLVVLRAKAFADDTALVTDPRFAGMPAVVTGDWLALRRSRLARTDSAGWAAARERWSDALWLTGAISRAGVPLLAGTDAGVLFTYPGSSLHDELELLVEAGLSPAAALAAATVQPARFLGAADTLGAVRAGMRADLVLVDANPFEEIGNTRRIAEVVLGGRRLPRR